MHPNIDEFFLRIQTTFKFWACGGIKFDEKCAILQICNCNNYSEGHLLIAADRSIITELRLCETRPFPPAPDPVRIENCKQLFSPLLAFTTQKIAIHSTDIISAGCVAFFFGS